MTTGTLRRVTHVLVAGGGVAGLETMMALHHLAAGRVDVTVLTPEDEFVFRPMAVAEPFSRGRAKRLSLREIAGQFGAQLTRGTLASVDAQARPVTLEDGEAVAYDELVIAVGAGSEPAVQHATTWTPEADPDVFAGLLADLEEGYTKRVAFVVPPHVAWPLPAYELALMTAYDAHDMNRDDVDVVVVTHESAPLDLFGAEASRALEEDLREAGVRVQPGTLVRDGKELDAQRVVALPQARANAPQGVPTDERGFIPVDKQGRVEGLEHVWAAGDVTNFPVKQGGLAAQQADAVAEAIAAAAGAEGFEPRPFRPVLRGVVLTGRGSQWLRRDLGEEDPEGAAARHALWWPPTKIAGRFLSGYLGEIDDAAAAGEGAEPTGQPVHLDLDREL